MNDSSLTLYQNGALAFKQARYTDAIASLEQFCKETVNRQSKPFFQAQMWLIQAYHKDHKDLHAIALCEQLAKSDIPQVKQWADKALQKLMVVSEPVAATRSTAEPPPPLPTAVTNAVEETPAGMSASESPISQEKAGAPPQFTNAINTIPKRSSQPVRSSAHGAKKTQQKDFTRQIMTAIAHGSISMLASILLFVLFSDSIVANGLGILRFAVPLLIFFTTQDKIVKENARAALNYAITGLILIIPLVFASFLLIFIFALMPPVGILLGLALGGYLIVFSFYPVVGTIICLTQEDQVFDYPNWLILHLI